jgi:hypothetical protein
VFAYLLDDNYPWPPKDVDQGEPAKQLGRFKDLLRKKHVVKVFKEDLQLAVFVTADLARLSLRAGLSDARSVSTSGAKDSAMPRATKNMTIPQVSKPSNSDEWNKERYAIYNKNKDLFLHYDLEASNASRQKYDVTIYLVRKSRPGSRRDDLQHVERVEFFFGPYWGDKVYTVVNTGNRIGIVTSAYGEFLAYCKVYIRGESRPVDLHQFIRFPDDAAGDEAGPRRVDHGQVAINGGEGGGIAADADNGGEGGGWGQSGASSVS